MKTFVGKKLVAGALALALMISPFASAATRAAAAGAGAAPAAAASANFSDVEKSYAKTEITELVRLGILSGDGSGNFNPTAGSTRAEMAKVLTLSLGLTENPQAAAAFKDIPANAWFKGYVGALVEAKITTGTSATSFSPNEQVSREALAVFYVRAMGLEDTAKKLAGKTEFADADQISAWALPAVALAAELGFIQGVKQADGKVYFQPAAKAERQALAKLTYSFYVNKEAYVEKAAKLEEAAASPSPTPTPSASTSPSPTPTPATGGGGYVPPVSTPTPTPTAAPTAAPTMGPGDATVDAPYFTGKYYAKDWWVYGLADGHATIRIYYNNELIAQDESDYSGKFDIFLDEKAESIEAGNLYVTSQREGENESQPLSVPVNEPTGEKSTAPHVDTIHAGDILATGTAAGYASINIQDADGNYAGWGYTSQGIFRASLYGNVTEGQTLYFTAKESNKQESDPVAVTVAAAATEKTPDDFLLNTVYEGPLYLNLGASEGLQFKIILSNSGISTESGGVVFDPNIKLAAGDIIKIKAQVPGKGPSEKLVTVAAASGKTEKPTASETIKYNISELAVQTEPNAFVYMTDDNGKNYGYAKANPSSERIINLYSYTKPASTVKLYAYVPGKAVSDPTDIQVAALEGRAPQASVTETVYEGDTSFKANVQEGYTLKVYKVGDEPLNYYWPDSYTSDNGVINGRFYPEVPEPGAKLILVTEKEGFEASKPVVVVVQPVTEVSAEPTVTGSVYEGDRYIPLTGDYSRVFVYDGHGNPLRTLDWEQESGNPYLFLENEIPADTNFITVKVWQIGKKAFELNLPVFANEGVTDEIVVINEHIKPDTTDIQIVTKPGDQVSINYSGEYGSFIVADSGITSLSFDHPKVAGDSIIITVKSPGKEAVTYTLYVESL